MSHKPPMSLKDLPEYLKSLKENGDTGSNLVGTGQIVQNRPWFKIMASTMLICAILGGITYYLTSTQDITVIVDIDDNPLSDSIPEIVSDSGGQIIAVKQNEDSTYEVKIDTKRNKRLFLDKLRKNKNVKKVLLKN